MVTMPDSNLRMRAGLRIVYLTPCYFHDRSEVSGIARYPINVARGVAESSRGTCAVDVIACDSNPREHT